MQGEAQRTVRADINDLPFGSDYSTFGCTVNRIGVDELFSKYEACGFMYAAKKTRLQPYWARVVDNWRRSMSAPAGCFLNDVVVFEDSRTGAWASMSHWATTTSGGQAQHLVSVGRPEGSRAVMLPTHSQAHARGHVASQNWFRAENRFPARVFGSCTPALGPAHAVLHEHCCVTIAHESMPELCGTVKVTRCTDADSKTVELLAVRLCGEVQAKADEWAAGDIGLSQLDERFKTVGLRRHRTVFIAVAHGVQEPVGLAVAYRGPLGLNFSFLENRCELWIDPHLDAERRDKTIASLVKAASHAYTDCELPFML
ncbi:MAG: hypothetical protein ACOYN0_18960, partial [Phycisphaerales bacterium]